MDTLLSYFNPYTSILISTILPYIPHVLKVPAVQAKLQAMTKANNGKGPKGYNLKNPRQSTVAAIDDTPEGQFIYRCQNCHANGFESFPIFAIAMLAGVVAGVENVTLQQMGLVYTVSRLLYTYLYCYGTNMTMAMARSTVWGISYAVPCYILYKAILGKA